MKKKLMIFCFSFLGSFVFCQELLANVQVNYSQIGGSNTQVFKTLEKNLKDFINNTSWTGKQLQNFEKIKCNFALVILERPSQNMFKGTLVVQSVRPVFNSDYATPMLNINDVEFSFEYIENENLIFNDRQFSGKNLIDVVSFYAYLILGYDGDSFQARGGQNAFEQAMKINQNAQNRNFDGWSQIKERTRGRLISTLLNEQSNTLRNTSYTYHRTGLDNLSGNNSASAKTAISESIMKLKYYETNFQLNYPVNIFIEAKKDEIFNLFSGGNSGVSNIGELKNLLSTLSPKDISQWNKLK